MKRKSLIFNSILAVFIIFGSFLFNSCSKEDDIAKKQNQQELSQVVDIARINQIELFRTNAKENLKSGTLIDANEAQILIEATINYTYAWADFEYEEIIVDTIFVEVNVNNDQMTTTDAIQAYNTILEELLNQYNNIEANEKKFVFVDLFFDEASDIPVIIVESGFGTKSNLKAAPIVDDDDWWYWGHEHGKCDEFSGFEGLIYDAADLIKREAKSILRTSMSGYYWENYTTEIMNPTDHPAPAGEDWDYLLFYWGASGNWMWRPEPCLSPDDNTFFINSYVQVVEDFEAEHNKQFANYMVYNDNAYFNANHGAWYTHKKHEGSIKLAIKKRKKPKDQVPTEWGL